MFLIKIVLPLIAAPAFFPRGMRWCSRSACKRCVDDTGRRSGPRSDLSLPQLLMGLVYHFLSGPGTLGEHVQMLLGVNRAEATLAGRRAALPWALFTELLQACLQPRAQKISALA